uniref:Uncharacterized protein n=1 Tax=Tanacetum cinerariifolium TaxID=118510 RepID=A0A6L2M584_TANCI|nr:hypothetical protein [Tanacetum cinerariifolium]
MMKTIHVDADNLPKKIRQAYVVLSSSSKDNDSHSQFGFVNKTAGKTVVTQPETISVADLMPIDTNKGIEVRVYRKWTATNGQDPKPCSAVC